MTGHQAIIAGSAYVSGFVTVLLWMRSKITQNLGNQCSDHDGAGEANINHYAAASNLKGAQDHDQ